MAASAFSRSFSKLFGSPSLDQGAALNRDAKQQDPVSTHCAPFSIEASGAHDAYTPNPSQASVAVGMASLALPPQPEKSPALQATAMPAHVIQKFEDAARTYNKSFDAERLRKGYLAPEDFSKRYQLTHKALAEGSTARLFGVVGRDDVVVKQMKCDNVCALALAIQEMDMLLHVHASPAASEFCIGAEHFTYFQKDDVHVFSVVMPRAKMDAVDYCAELLNYSASLQMYRIFLTIIQHMIKGMLALHTLGIAHRDLKLENVLLFQTPEGNLHFKLCDFGYADQHSIQVKRPHTPCGTPLYLHVEALMLNRPTTGVQNDYTILAAVVDKMVSLLEAERPALTLSVDSNHVLNLILSQLQSFYHKRKDPVPLCLLNDADREYVFTLNPGVNEATFEHLIQDIEVAIGKLK